MFKAEETFACFYARLVYLFSVEFDSSYIGQEEPHFFRINAFLGGQDRTDPKHIYRQACFAETTGPDF